MKTEDLSELKKLAQEVSQREGCQLYDVEFVGSQQGRVLRVYIDRSQAEGGVTVDECANVSRGLSLLLDVNDLVPGEKYDLEVSSPGLERPLKEIWHYEVAVGEVIHIRTNAALTPPKSLAQAPKNMKRIQGELTNVNSEGIGLMADGGLWEIPYTIIHKAHVVFVTENKNFKKKR